MSNNTGDKVGKKDWSIIVWVLPRHTVIGMQERITKTPKQTAYVFYLPFY